MYPIHRVRQGGHDTGKTGYLVLTFSRQGKHREFCCKTGKIFEIQGKYFLLYSLVQKKSMFSSHIFNIFGHDIISSFKSLSYILSYTVLLCFFYHISYKYSCINQTGKKKQ